jgi:hypothetical protein
VFDGEYLPIPDSGVIPVGYAVVDGLDFPVETTPAGASTPLFALAGMSSTFSLRFTGVRSPQLNPGSVLPIESHPGPQLALDTCSMLVHRCTLWSLLLRVFTSAAMRPALELGCTALYHHEVSCGSHGLVALRYVQAADETPQMSLSVLEPHGSCLRQMGFPSQPMFEDEPRRTQTQALITDPLWTFNPPHLHQTSS